MRAILRIDLATGAQTVVSSDGYFSYPYGLAIESDGNLIVSDIYAGVIRVDQTTGQQTVLTRGPSTPIAVAIDSRGDIILTGGEVTGGTVSRTVSRIDPASGERTVISQDGFIVRPFAVALGTDDTIFITDDDTASTRRVVRIDPTNGEQTVVATGPHHWGGIAVVRGPSAPADTTPPDTTATQTPGPNSNGWNNSDVAVVLSSVDNAGGSGVQEVHYSINGGPDIVVPGDSAQFVLAAEGMSVVTYFAKDEAGNSEAPTTLTVRIDKTPPAVTYTGNAGTYTVDQEVSITCSAQDALSGVESGTCHDISGPAYAFELGTNTFSASATDRAGNVGTGSTSFTVRVTADSLANLVTRFVTQPGIRRSLLAKLDAAKAAEERGNANAKAGALGAFINEVEAQTGKAIGAQEAAILTTLARAL